MTLQYQVKTLMVGVQGTSSNMCCKFLFHNNSYCTPNISKDESYALHINIDRRLVPGSQLQATFCW